MPRKKKSTKKWWQAPALEKTVIAASLTASGALSAGFIARMAYENTTPSDVKEIAYIKCPEGTTFREQDHTVTENNDGSTTVHVQASCIDSDGKPADTQISPAKVAESTECPAGQKPHEPRPIGLIDCNIAPNQPQVAKSERLYTKFFDESHSTHRFLCNGRINPPCESKKSSSEKEQSRL